MNSLCCVSLTIAARIIAALGLVRVFFFFSFNYITLLLNLIGLIYLQLLFEFSSFISSQFQFL